MVLGSSDLPAGDAIGMHRHLQEDEILLILRGNAQVDLAGRKYEAGPGGAIYIPQGTCVAVANAGRDTLTTFFIFSAPGFEQVLREVSSRPGEPPKRLSPSERVAAFHRGHAVANPLDCRTCDLLITTKGLQRAMRFNRAHGATPTRCTSIFHRASAVIGSDRTGGTILNIGPTCSQIMRKSRAWKARSYQSKAAS